MKQKLNYSEIDLAERDVCPEYKYPIVNELKNYLQIHAQF